MDDYIFRVLCRQIGAIGVFSWETFTEIADSEEQAKERLRLHLTHNREYNAIELISSNYQGWTNSKTWNAAYLVNQEQSAYKNLTAIAKIRPVIGNDVKAEFNRLHLHCDNCTKGVINWQEIADEHYNKS